MKSVRKFPIGTALLSIVFATVPAIAQLTISGNVPAQTGGTYTLPVTVSAHATGNVGGWQVYFGNTSYYSSSTGLGGTLDVSLSNVPPGTYQVTVTAYESGSGTPTSYVAQNVTVVSSPLPTPESGWSSPTYPNLQNTSDDPGSWTPCTSNLIANGNPCAGGTSQTGATSTLTQKVASPSLSGASMAEYSSSNDVNYNTMFYQHLGCPSGGCDAAGNMIDDLWFFPAPSPSSGFQQMEFDPDLYDTNGYEYQGSVACEMDGTDAGTWRVWNMALDAWTSTSRSCTIAPQQWHHLQLYVTYNTTGSGCPNSVPCYTYKTLVFDGSTVFDNLDWSYNAVKLSSFTTTLNVQQQIDNFKTGDVANTVYYDNYNLWVW
jgi:hypothetical protein